MTLKELKTNIRGVFKQPQKKYYFGRLYFGSPWYFPRKFNQNIITIRKAKTPELNYAISTFVRKFGYVFKFGFPIYVTWHGLYWKDKYETPRMEHVPTFQIYFFWWQFCIFWNAPNSTDSDTYYEMILWYLNYSNCDIKKAKETWGWVDGKTKKSTWNDDFLLK